jgi:CIC family chloride channel protein
LIHLNELRYTFFNEDELANLVVAADLVHRDVPTLLPGDTLDLAIKLLGETGLDTLPVMDPEEPGRVKGIITRDAVIDTYNRELLDRDLAGETAGLMVTVERARTVDLGNQTLLMEIEAPSRMVGQRLRDLRLRHRFDVQVMLVRREVAHGGSCSTTREIPGPDFVLRAGDVLLLLGNAEGLRKMSKV